MVPYGEVFKSRRPDQFSKHQTLRSAMKITIADVAKHFSATFQEGPHTYLSIGRRRINVIFSPLDHDPKPAVTARLREDAVALRVLRGIENALAPHIPNGKSVIITLGAPIKTPRLLMEALTAALKDYVVSGLEETDVKKNILGNRVRFRVMNNAKWRSKVFGFVFTGDPAPAALANILRSMNREVTKKGGTSVRFAGDKWLVLCNEKPLANMKTYQNIYSLLAPRHNFKKILILSPDGHVDVLADY